MWIINILSNVYSINTKNAKKTGIFEVNFSEGIVQIWVLAPIKPLHRRGFIFSKS